jgi:hypothetical protein
MRKTNGKSAGAKPARTWRTLRYAAFCGAGAGLASQAMLLAAALAEGQPLARPINATSHWLHGRRAGQVRGADMRHTALGAATNQSAALFWGTLFGIHLSRTERAGPAKIARDAALMGVIAAVIDYGLIPRRLTPGWELSLSKTSVALTMAATAAGLGLGGMAARALER